MVGSIHFAIVVEKMKVGDLVKLDFESSALGLIIRKIEIDDGTEWAGYGE